MKTKKEKWIKLKDSDLVFLGLIFIFGAMNIFLSIQNWNREKRILNILEIEKRIDHIEKMLGEENNDSKISP